MLSGPIRLLFLHDKESILLALQSFLRYVREDPNILFLGGQVEGYAASAYNIKRILQFPSRQHAALQAILCLTSPTISTVKVLQYPSIELLLLLQHHLANLRKTNDVIQS